MEEGQDGQVKVGLPLQQVNAVQFCSYLTYCQMSSPHSPDLQADFNSSKDELSTKKIRRKAEKAMKREVITRKIILLTA